MRAWLAIVIVVGTTARAVACWEPDLDDIASGGPTVATFRIDGLFKTVVRAVPSRPSLYFHRGEDESGPPPTFTDEDGRPIASVPICTGIPEYPIRFDLAITAGTIINSEYDHVQYEVAVGMTPHTRSVKDHRWNGFVVIEIDSDAALLRFEHAGKTWFESNWPPSFTRYFDTMDVRISALYANRTEEVIFDRSVPRPPPDHRVVIVAIALLGVLALVGLLVCRGSRSRLSASRW
ncbi:MAG: hypothetical protein H6Q90_3023 [Deltaproteobacteria bacterium]|nr:hypothetical protein [Deltaproteobacteria bacterium]